MVEGLIAKVNCFITYAVEVGFVLVEAEELYAQTVSESFCSVY